MIGGDGEREGAVGGRDDHTVTIGRSTDKRYAGDNRLILPKSPHRRECLAPVWPPSMPLAGFRLMPPESKQTPNSYTLSTRPS